MRQKNQTTGGKPISDVEHLQGLQNEKDFLWSVKQTPHKRLFYFITIAMVSCGCELSK